MLHVVKRLSRGSLGSIPALVSECGKLTRMMKIDAIRRPCLESSKAAAHGSSATSGVFSAGASILFVKIVRSFEIEIYWRDRQKRVDFADLLLFRKIEVGYEVARA